MRHTTKQHKDYWTDRKIDWDAHYTVTYDHPHRQAIIDKLKQWKWISILEVGCASGPNLINIFRHFPHADVAGVDVNADAIDTARKQFVGLTDDWNKYYGNVRVRQLPWFKVNSADNIMISDGACDIVMSDMTLIYVGRKDIKKYLMELRRVTRGRIMLMEFHHKNWLKRLVTKWKTGYNVHDYKKLLTEVGFHDIQVEKVTPEPWKEHEPHKSTAYLVTARK
jgi:ubiquinone/menaquinone biosynthesis C-methylase UbiE